MTIKETKKKEKQTELSYRPSFLELVKESVWNAVTWLPTLFLAKMLDED